MANSRFDQCSIIQLSNLTYLMGCTVYGASGSDSSSAVINFYTSSDLSSWTLLSNISSPSGIGYYIPSLYLKSNGDLLVVFVEKPTAITSRLLYMTSSDSGATWGGLSVIRENVGEYLVVASGRIMVTDTGRLLMGVAKNTNGILDSATGNYTGYIYYSDDEGANWSVSASTMVSPDNLCVEQGIYKKNASTIVMYCRNRSTAIYACNSTDNGTTWGSVYSLGIPAIDSQSSILRLSNGYLLAVYNTPDRRTMKMSYSADSGTTWSRILIITSESVKNNIEPFLIEAGSMINIFYSKSNTLITKFDIRRSSFNLTSYIP